MIVTRRWFLAGSSAITVAGVAVSKFALPRLLPAPNKSALPSAWTLGLLGEDGRELYALGYERRPLDMIERDGYLDLVPADGHTSVAWKFPSTVTVTGWVVWMPGVTRPFKMSSQHFPQTIHNGVLTLNVDDGYIVRLT